MTLRPARLEDESADRFGVPDRSFTWRQAHERGDRAPSSRLAPSRPVLRRPSPPRPAPPTSPPAGLSAAEKTEASRRRDHAAALAVRRLREEAGVEPGRSAPPELRDRINAAVSEITGRPLEEFHGLPPPEALAPKPMNRYKRAAANLRKQRAVSEATQRLRTEAGVGRARAVSDELRARILATAAEINARPLEEFVK